MIIEIFEYSFIIKALIAGILLSLCCSLLGNVLVLKRYAMIGDGLSHVGFGALAVAAAFNFAPLFIAVPIVIVAAFFLIALNKKEKLNGDALTALISASSLAIGVIIISVTKKGNAEISSYLFGNILALSDFELYTSIILSVIVTLIFVFLYVRIFAVTFDETFAFSVGANPSVYNGIIAVLTAVTVVLGMKLMGSLLISALIIFPTLSAMCVFKSYKKLTVFTPAISVSCFVIGFIMSYLFELPTGAGIVVTNLIYFIMFNLIGKLIKS